MNSLFLRFIAVAFFMYGLASLSAAEPKSRPLTDRETTILQEPIAIGKTVYNAVCRYYTALRPRDYPVGPALLTESPTVELLHALGYITESELRLAQQYRIAIPPVVVKATDRLVILDTKSGELSFDTRGNITLNHSSRGRR